MKNRMVDRTNPLPVYYQEDKTYFTLKDLERMNILVAKKAVMRFVTVKIRTAVERVFEKKAIHDYFAYLDPIGGTRWKRERRSG